ETLPRDVTGSGAVQAHSLSNRRPVFHATGLSNAAELLFQAWMFFQGCSISWLKRYPSANKTNYLYPPSFVSGNKNACRDDPVSYLYRDCGRFNRGSGDRSKVRRPGSARNDCHGFPFVTAARVSCS